MTTSENPAELEADRCCEDCNAYHLCRHKLTQPASSCSIFVPILGTIGAANTETATSQMRNTKESNPKYSEGVKKAPLHCIPCGPLFEVGLAMYEGNRKYGRHNYRAVGVRASIYYDAAIGHIADWWEGENIDLDSGVHHIIKAIACLFVVRDSMLMGNFNDDRPLRYPEKHGRSDFNAQVKLITDKYPDCAKPFLETDKYISAGDPTKELGVEELVLCNRINEGYCSWDCIHREPHKRIPACNQHCCQRPNAAATCKEVK